MNQQSTIPFGTDATKIAGYAQSTERLGNVDFLITNTGDNQLSMKIAQFVSGNPSSYAVIVPMFTVQPKGNVTKSLCIASQQIAFFGSGNTTANITPVLRNPADLRGAQIDITQTGRFGWTTDIAAPAQFGYPVWPSLPNDGSGTNS